MPKGSFVYDRWVMLGLTVFSYQGLSFCDNFGIYSAQVKQQYGFSQDQLDSIATAGFWPNLVGAAIIPGLVNDRYGAPVTLVGAGVFTFLGLFVFWLTISEGIPIVAGSPHAQLMLCAGLTCIRSILRLATPSCRTRQGVRRSSIDRGSGGL